MKKNLKIFHLICYPNVIEFRTLTYIWTALHLKIIYLENYRNIETKRGQTKTKTKFKIIKNKLQYTKNIKYLEK